LRPLAPTQSSEKIRVLWELRHVQDELPETLHQAFSRVNMAKPELNKLTRQEAIARWQRFPGDTGSPEVQIAVMTEKLRVRNEHLRVMRKDMNAKRKVQNIVSARNRMLKYLRRHNFAKYQEVLEGLNIRPTRAFDISLYDHRHISTTKEKWPQLVEKIQERRKKKKKGTKGNAFKIYFPRSNNFVKPARFYPDPAAPPNPEP